MRRAVSLSLPLWRSGSLALCLAASLALCLSALHSGDRCDFGVAYRTTERSFTFCGTPEYIAPEVWLSKGAGKGVDVWALGIMTWLPRTLYRHYGTDT